MKLSILVPTHQRPTLFKECINSIKQFNLPIEYEIIVNNDSDDIIEEYDGIDYNYYKGELHEIMRFLLSKAKGQYIYILEDDDLLLEGFIDILNEIDTAELHIGLYDSELNECKLQTFKDMIRGDLNFKHFQMSQIVFKNIHIDIPYNNNVENDEIMFNQLKEKLTVRQHRKFLFKQRIFGDNISYLALKEFL